MQILPPVRRIMRTKIFSILFDNVTLDEAAKSVQALIIRKEPAYVVEVNTDVALKAENDPELLSAISGSALTFADGKPIVWISRWYKKPLKERVAGSDLIPKMFELAVRNNWSVFLLGGADGVAEEAARRMKEMYSGIRIVGTYAPPFGFEQDEEELTRINHMLYNADADLVIACFGCPKQEKWAAENYRECGSSVIICGGGTIDFLAGRVQRCPKWMADHGLEWFYRFTREPKRLFHRYFIDDPKILRMVWKYRKQRRREQ